MKHSAYKSLWRAYDSLPKNVQRTADKQYRLLSENPRHRSLHFKHVKGTRFWSASVTQDYRALAVPVDSGF